jgi:hypothetical protein
LTGPALLVAGAVHSPPKRPQGRLLAGWPTKPRYTDRQIAQVLRQAEQDAPGGLCRKLGGSRTTLYHWSKKYVGTGVAELRHKVPDTERYDRGGHEMATDDEIQKFVQGRHGFIPKVGWIAHVKEVHGIPTLRGAKRARRDRKVEPCPAEKREAIEEAFRHFGMM